jgi:hypothetical protein
MYVLHVLHCTYRMGVGFGESPLHPKSVYGLPATVAAAAYCGGDNPQVPTWFPRQTQQGTSGISALLLMNTTCGVEELTCKAYKKFIHGNKIIHVESRCSGLVVATGRVAGLHAVC